MTLSEPQKKLLAVASSKVYVYFSDALKAGGSGVTLSALCKKGLLEKTSYPNGSNDWRITDAGRVAAGASSSASQTCPGIPASSATDSTPSDGGQSQDVTDADLRDVWESVVASLPDASGDERRIAFARAVLSMRCAEL